jgi:predicted dienelactone hydrolase
VARVPRNARRVAPPRPGTRRSRRPLVLLVVVVALAALGAVVASAATQTNDGKKDSARPRRYYVGEVTCRFVDYTRQSVNRATGQKLPYRVLETEIRYPTYSIDGGAGAPASAKPFALIVFAHGFSSLPDWYKPLLDVWVRAGFVVAAPIFPETNANAVHLSANPVASEGDDVNQPGDIAFVIHSLIADSRARSAACPTLAGLIDASRIGIAGQSDGGETVAMAAYDPRYDSHPGLNYRAVAVLSGAEWTYPSSGPDPYANHPSAPPLLVVQSATDACNPPQESTKLYDDDASTTKWFLEIFNAQHLAPYDGRNAQAFAIVARTTTRFFQFEVDGDGSGAKLMKVGNSESQVARLTMGASAPPITPLTPSIPACYVGIEGLEP